jgi:AcrR family transcriptional regulator
MGKKKRGKAGDGADSFHDTRSRLLDTVEKLLAERHELDVSLRDITNAAGVNVAAVSYHFGSKDALVQEVIDRAVARLAQRQFAALSALGRRQPPPGAAEILEAWMSPSLDPEAGERIAVMARVARRAGFAKARLPQELSEKSYEKVRRLVFKLLSERWPHLPPEELKFRIVATRIAMAALMSTALDNPGVSHGVSLNGIRRKSERILSYMMRGMLEPEALEKKPGAAVATAAKAGTVRRSRA